jgi:segregation and condensation protein B
MAKRKKKGRANPAAAAQANAAEAELRPAETEIEGEVPEVATESVSETQPEAAPIAEEPVAEARPEGAEAETAAETPAAEPAESAEDVSASESAEAESGAEAPAAEPAESAEDVSASESAEAEFAASDEATTGEEPATTEAAGEAPAEDVWAEDRVAEIEGEPPSGESGEQDSEVWTESSEGAEAGPAGEGEPAPTGEEGEEGTPAILDSTQMESIIEGLLFASDRVLGLADLKRLLGERDGKKITAALESLVERRKGSGIEVVRLSNGWHLRTNSEHARWVSKLLAGKPMRLSRAMMETLAIVAYRQPVTRPEIDEIRGVDCGPVLKTLLDRGLIRIIGKKEDVGRPLLYGTTPEFLRVFNLRELTELPTLREYAELNSEQQAVVNAKHGPAAEGQPAPESAGEGVSPEASVEVASAGPNLKFVPRGQLPDEPEDSDPLLDELDAATKDASKVLGAAQEPAPEAAAEASETAAPEPSAPVQTEPSRES